MSDYDYYSLVLNQQNNNSTANSAFTNLQPPTLDVVLPTPWYSIGSEVALASLYVYYSWNNITSAFNNNQCSYTWVDGTSHAVNFPDGYYGPSDITGYIQYVMTNNGHYLVDNNGNKVFYIQIVANQVYYSDTIVCSPVPNGSLPTGYTNPNSVPLNGKVPQLQVLNTPAGINFGTLIGFPVGYYPPTLAVGAQYSINSINIPKVTNIANTGSFNSVRGIISSFAPGNTPFGGQIIVQPTFPTYFKVDDGRYSQITVSFYDDSNRPVVIIDPEIICVLSIRTRKSQK
jgi:hypothetical protein